MIEMRRCRLLCPGTSAAELGNRHGGVMRIGRAVIILAILTLVVTGSSLASNAMSGMALHISNTHVLARGHFPVNGVYLHG